ncbi:MAG: glycosyl hydrolase 115 family protein [Bacteroidaceae bacterium]|nr:glycosyl hydrolase 115 family protein [Bacteroidaceae bacterium]
MKSFVVTLVMTSIALTLQAGAFVLPAHSTVRVLLGDEKQAVVTTALDLLQSDLQRVLDATLKYTSRSPQILVGTVDGEADEWLAAAGIESSWLHRSGQSYILAVNAKGQLIVAGSDAYGVAYGLMELSRRLGVSPLEWWADVVPEPLEQWSLPEGFTSRQSPNVSFRGIQLGDIEWGLRPWMARTFEPDGVFPVDQKTMRRIFELMLRQRLNLFWTSVDGAPNGFFDTKVGRAMANAYGIFLGRGIHDPINIAGLEDPYMIADDGFGYLTHFPTPEQSASDKGCGVYYHASYRGAPHDYLWLGTASPFLMCQQLSEAMYHDASRVWVLNVGDIKPLEYQLTLFSDMAWDIQSVRDLSVGRHLEEFFAQNVGRDVARLLSIYMKEFYHLSFQCKPEHLAGTRVGETADSAVDWNQVRDLPWSERFIRHRLDRYDLMRRNIEWLSDSIYRQYPSRRDAFFELVEYPVQAAINQNLKYLLAQLARHNHSWLASESVAQTWRRSDLAHNEVQKLTLRYNALRHDKWQGILSSNPASLQVFQPVPHTLVTSSLRSDPPAIASFYGASYQASSFSGGGVLDPVLGLGASIRAMPVPKECNVTYKYRHNYGRDKSTYVEVRLLPTHPIEEQQRFSLSLDGSEPQIFTYDAEVGSEEWKKNVLRNYAVVRAYLPITRPAGEHEIVVTALDDGVVVDELFVRTTAAIER